MATSKSKKNIHKMVEALIKGDSEAAATELHSYLQGKTRELMLGESKDEECDDCGKSPCECDDDDDSDDKDDDKKSKKSKKDDDSDDKDDKKKSKKGKKGVNPFAKKDDKDDE